MATSGGLPGSAVPRGLRASVAKSTHAMAGASHCANAGAWGAEGLRAGKSRRLSRAEGGRGFHERNCVSSGFISFIIFTFQAGTDFLQAIAIAAGGGVG